jgi:D-sedoheptulose 7-phosphate isomerase
MTFEEIIAEHIAAAVHTGSVCGQDFARASAMVSSALKDGRTVFAAGNGGSAADAQHFAAELTGRFIRNRRPLPGIALTTDSSAVTAIANDFGFEEVFARQIEALGRAGDVFVAISTSGNSANILHACKKAKQLGILVVGMTGRGGGQLASAADVCLCVPCDTTARIQEMHEVMLHALCEAVESL